MKRVNKVRGAGRKSDYWNIQSKRMVHAKRLNFRDIAVLMGGFCLMVTLGMWLGFR